jgi:hypothetical protein
VADLRQFDLDLSKFSEQIEKSSGKFIKKIAFTLLRDIVLRTPVDTGRARANWHVSVGASSNAVFGGPDTKFGASGGASLALGSMNQLANYGEGGRYPPIWLQNNLPYIVRLENGWSKQAPSGMVAVALNNIRLQLELMAREA